MFPIDLPRHERAAAGLNGMKLTTITAITALMALAATPVIAFDEQTTAVPDGATAKSAAPKADTPAATPGVQNYATPDSAASGADNTEIRIPGLGKLGELPKMDFGLELLYGATETQEQIEDSQDPEATTDDLRIRGTIKHQF